MNDDNKTPLAFRFRLRMLELLKKALDDGTLRGEDWDPDALGYTVFGGDSLLQQDSPLVADIVGYHLGRVGATEEDINSIIRGMESRRYTDEFNRG